ncbi:hypothetical protein HYH03_013394 [Edaphochlamys debaryana]|uniref:Peptidase C1A papain C-terminal domain-containing protein n=1 Tax=Edaphochlamys debaryana TaxID=47281 RepID=A0A835XTR1_9CHLO|nr:hypothetical protein HYH03_013394 [Edaphochlamys debaryana]|eukprot:KAG2488091.1 hypothetical protein HYH03_013394 [Edaphochlamys debaryana]
MARGALSLLALASLLGVAFGARPMSDMEILSGPTPPVWPLVYEMEYTISLPYLQTLQPGGLKYPVHVWWDGPGRRVRYDFYGGLDSSGGEANKGTAWNLYPRIDALRCDASNGTVGPTALGAALEGLGLGEGVATTPLPDISHWTYAGTARIGNADATAWQLNDRHGEKTASYTFYTAPNGWPVRLHMMGLNLLTGSHYDEYVLEWTRFKPGPIADRFFDLPGPCQELLGAGPQDGDVEASGRRLAGAALRAASVLPSALLGGAGSLALAALRDSAASAWAANAALVESHNARVAAATSASVSSSASATSASEAGSGSGSDGPSYTLSLNHFGHLTHRQWAATSLGLGPRRTAGAGGKLKLPSGRPYQRVLRNDQLPTQVDWRGSGADGPGVKDQVSCGSCWAFGVVGALQAAWFQATGQSLSFSEQQLVDCAWEYGNDGCAGGYIEPTLDYVIDAGGMAQESDYPYLAQNGYCRGPGVKAPASAGPPAPLAAKFSGYVNVPSRDEGAVMEALHLQGPLAVLINAALPPFKFYSEGVYHNDACGMEPDDMDHVVLLVGYGTTAEGVDYWLIKNSWSKYWGMDGYARVTRKGNDCGISLNAVFATVDAQAAEAVEAA